MFRRRGQHVLAMFACLVVQAVMHASVAAEPADRHDEATPPFGITYEMPYDGFTAAHVYDRDGKKLIRRLSAEIARQSGDAREAWDLRDDAGRPVAPGEYTWKILARPPFTLTYELTVNNAGQPAWWAPAPGTGGGPICV